MALTTPITVKTGADPAPGAEALVTVPAGEYWVVHAVLLTLVTSATVANRRVELQIDNGTTTFFRLAHAVDQTASLTWRYQFANHGYRDAAVTGSNNVANLGVPVFTLGPGYRIQTSTANIQAGDDYAAPVLFVADYT